MAWLKPIRILTLEDNPADAELIQHALSEGGLRSEVVRVESKKAFEEALQEFRPDIVLLDWNLPDFDGRAALQIVGKRSSSVPAIIVTGTLGEEQAVETLKSGAADFVLKDRLARLAPAVTRALEEAKERRQHADTQRKLESNFILLKTEQENSPDGILVVDQRAHIISYNHLFTEMWCIPPDSMGTDDGLILKSISEQLKDWEGFKARVEYLYAHPQEKSHEEIDLKDGRVFDRHSSPMFDPRGNYLGRVWFFRDITAQLAMAKNLKLFRELANKSNDTMEVIDLESLRIADINEKGCADLGYVREELLGMSVADIDVELNPENAQVIKEQLRTTGKAIFETKHKRKDGTTFPVEVSISAFSADRRNVLASARDITERKRAQAILEESELRFRSLIEDMADSVSIVGKDGTIRYTSPAVLEMMGFPSQDLIGKPFLEFIPQSEIAAVTANFAQILQDHETTLTTMIRIRRRNGTSGIVQGKLRNRIGVLPIDGIIATFRDVTEMERSIRALRAISSTESAMLRATDEGELAHEISNIMVEIGGYTEAWIGYLQFNEEKSIRIVAQSGEGSGYLGDFQMTWGESNRGRGPSGTAARTGKTQLVLDYPGSLPDPAWQEAARSRGYLACIAIPLAGPAGIWGVLTLYSDSSEAFDEDELNLLERLAADLSYGVQAIRDRRQHLLDQSRLEKAIEDTIHALSTAVEKRDPYTAGHQTRVARLCVAIAKKLGLDQECTHGLELAALIHDVGKIEVPSEILSKPTKLSAAEFMLIKVHPEAGYDILKDITFPWPVAKIVLQHHERLDGSGYPSGLRDGEILLESRILQVADVVEAMSSHRPYRPALGIDLAIEEITRYSGSRYDPTVVQACVEVCRMNGVLS